MRTLHQLGLLFLCGAFLFPAGCRAAAGAGEKVARRGGEAPPPAYPPEEIYDTAVRSDEALVDVRLAASRWPDCYELSSAMRDILRIEGRQKASGQQKAFALWKWFRVLVSATGGSYAFEHVGSRKVLVHDPHKIFAVYGHHQCDGLSWAMVGLWRGVGYVGFDECTHGHTTAALRYRDDDGKLRYHSFDPQARCYYWYSKLGRVGTRSVPVMRGMVYRHITAPQRLHCLRTSLRVGETVVRRWDNTGHVVPSGKDKAKAEGTKYYTYAPGKTDGVYAAAGEEVQTLVASTDPKAFAGQLYAGSAGAACSAPAAGKATLHPEKSDRPAGFVYRLAPPYVVADAKVEAVLVTGAAGDVCRLLLSADGVKWTPIYEKKKPGAEKVAIDIGKAAWKKNRPNVYTGYNFFVKAEFKTANDPATVGMNGLKVTVFRHLNKRTLPNLRPGENWLRVTAGRLAKGLALELELSYRVKDKAFKEKRVISKFPYYFKVNVTGAQEFVLGNYDRRFNVGDVRMDYFKMRLVPAAAGGKPSLPEAEGRARFAASYPHPAKMINQKTDRRREPKDVREVNGFFPQGDVEPAGDEATMKELIKGLKGNREKNWRAVEDLGNHPKSVDALLAALPGANIDQTLFICKVLAKLKPSKAVKPLLAKWKKHGSDGAPGTRHIPDVLAAIGDRSVVPQLIAPLKKVRFDFRLHIAHALGILGGPEAEKALRDLAANDPFLGVRQEAERALLKIEKAKKTKKGR